MMKKRDRDIALTTLAAIGIGYAVGILTAPKSGRETRKELQRAATKAKKDGEKQLKRLHTELSDLIEQGKEKAKKAKAVTREELEKAIDKAGKVKEKARELLSSIHEGDGEDRDLQKAIEEAKNATRHLKKYLKNYV